jgi:glyoxylase I family protein
MTIAYRISHVGLCVSDIAASQRFYCQGLGFELAEGYDLTTDMLPGLGAALEIDGPVAMRSQMIRREGITIELLAYSKPNPAGQPSMSRASLGFTHLSFYVDDIETAINHLVSCGGALLSNTRQDLGIQVAFLADPDGSRIELMQA